MKGSTLIGRLRMIGVAEGISLLLLMFIAMPLKYFFAKPEMVKIVGWAHGVLFIAFMVAVVMVAFVKKWPFSRILVAFVAAFLPFGTFWFDRKLKKEELA